MTFRWQFARGLFGAFFSYLFQRRIGTWRGPELGVLERFKTKPTRPTTTVDGSRRRLTVRGRNELGADPWSFS